MFTILSTKKIGFIHSKKQKLKPGQDLSGKGSADKRAVKKSRLSTFPPSLLLLLIILFFLKSSTKRRADGASGNRERAYCSTGIFVRKSLVSIRVKGRRPLRVRAEPANLLPQGNPRRQAESELHKASRQACALSPSGDNTVSAVTLPPTPRDKTGTNKTQVLRRYGSRDDVPCGCRAEPANLLPQAILAVRRKPDSTKQATRLAPSRREAVVRQSRDPPTHPKR